MRLPAYEVLWKFNLKEMQEFLELTDAGVLTKFGEFSEWFTKNTHGMSKADVDDFTDHYYDDLAMVRDIVPQMLRRAQFLSIFGILESRAGGLCRCLKLDGITTKVPKKNLYLDDVQQYLTGYAAFKSGAFGTDWQFIMAARCVRNAIAHNNGKLRNDSQGSKAKAFVNKQPELEVDSLDQLDIKDGFCKELVHHVEVAMTSLIAEAKTKYPNYGTKT